MLRRENETVEECLRRQVQSKDPKDSLLNLMYLISEEEYFAGWLIDLEYILWDMMIRGTDLPLNKRKHFWKPEYIKLLREYSDACQGWYYWNGNKDPDSFTDDGYAIGATFISLEDWKKRYENVPMEEETDDILDQMVNLWHHSGSVEKKLHDYLGMSKTEYALWVERGEVPFHVREKLDRKILDRKKNVQHLQEKKMKFIETGISGNCHVRFGIVPDDSPEVPTCVRLEIESGVDQDFIIFCDFVGWNKKTVDQLIEQLNQIKQQLKQ